MFSRFANKTDSVTSTCT